MIRTIARTYRNAYRGLGSDLWLLSFVLLVNRAGGMVLPFIAIYLNQERGLSVVDVGRFLALYGLGAIVGAFVGGWLSDRIDPTRTQLLSLLASGVGYLAFVKLDGIVEMALGIFLLSIAVESFRPAVMTDMSRRAPAALQARAFALLRLAANLGAGVGPAVGGYLALHSYRWLFIADALTCWLAGLLLWAILGRRRPVAQATDDTTETVGRSPWRDGPFLLLMLLSVALAFVLFQTLSTLPLYFRRVYGFRENTIGLLLGLNPLLIVIFEMILIHWAEKRDRMRLIGLGAFLMCAGLALMPLGQALIYVMFTIVVWTLGEMLALPLVNAVVADRAPGSSRGRFMGLYTMSFSIAFTFAPALGTHVYELHGPDVLWFSMAVLGILLGIWALGLTRFFPRANVGPPPEG